MSLCNEFVMSGLLAFCLFVLKQVELKRRVLERVSFYCRVFACGKEILSSEQGFERTADHSGDLAILYCKAAQYIEAIEISRYACRKGSR